MEDVYKSITDSRKEHITILTEMIMEYIAYKVGDEGFDISLDECNVDYIMACEALGSLMCKSVGVFHPMQEIAQDAFGEESEEIPDE